MNDVTWSDLALVVVLCALALAGLESVWEAFTDGIAKVIRAWRGN